VNKKSNLSSRLFVIKNIDDQPEFSKEIKKLISRYFPLEKEVVHYSSETSSHWQKYSELQSAKVKGGSLELTGVGFGDYEAKDRKKYSVLFYAPYFLLLNIRSLFLSTRLRQAWKKVANSTNRLQSADFVRIATSLKVLIRHLKEEDFAKVVIIGDGYGTTGQIIKEIFPNSSITYINLGRALVFDAAFSFQAFPNASHNFIEPNSSNIGSDFNYIAAEDLQEVDCNGTLFINIASMQEMDTSTIEKYLLLIRAQQNKTLFYCSNREMKILPDGSEIRFSEYGWSENDFVFFYSSPAWLQWTLIRRPPFFRKLDGKVLQKLVKIK
jgi:putative sugar O-methyltransferase